MMMIVSVRLSVTALLVFYSFFFISAQLRDLQFRTERCEAHEVRGKGVPSGDGGGRKEKNTASALPDLLSLANFQLTSLFLFPNSSHRSSRYIPVVGDDAKAMSPLPSPLPSSRERSNTATTLPNINGTSSSAPASARDRRSRNRESRELRNMQDVNAPPIHPQGPAKRRSTMNSRDAAYDSAEIARRTAVSVDDERDRDRDRDRDATSSRGGRKSKRSRSGEVKDE